MVQKVEHSAECLVQAERQGRVVVVVLPISRYYTDAFLDKASIAAFENALSEAMATAPEARLVRLDQVPEISDNKYFLDLVHLNSSGRQVITPVFLKEVNGAGSKAKQLPSLPKSIDPANQ